MNDLMTLIVLSLHAIYSGPTTYKFPRNRANFYLAMCGKM